MADRLIQTGTLTDIADAIRAKTGKSATMTPLEMPTEIASIIGGGLPSPTLVTVTGGSCNDVLTQCRAAIGETNLVAIGKRYTETSGTMLLYWGIYLNITYPDRQRAINTAYRRTSGGVYNSVEFTATSTTGGGVPSGDQFLVWGLDYIDYE
jgi:hypothetical protein